MNNDENNINDHELDAVFREAARNNPPDFQESDWLAMSELLVKNPIPQPIEKTFDFKKRWLLGLLAMFISVGSIGWFYVNKTEENITVSKVADYRTLNKVDEQQIAPKTIEEQAFKAEDLENLQNESIKESESLLDEKRSSVKSEIESVSKALPSIIKRQKTAAERIENSRIIDEQSNSGYNTKIITSETSNQLRSSEPAAEPVIRSSILTDKNSEDKTSNLFQNGGESNELNEVRNQVGKRTAFANIETLESKSAKVLIEKTLPGIRQISSSVEEIETPSPNNPVVFQKGLSARIAYSPDFSTVNSDFFKIGNNSAFLVEYRLNNRFVVQSGVIKSVKKYSANPVDYQWPENWGTVPGNLSEVTATCDMLDIPLNLRFDISQKQATRFFVSAGATSYLMLNELYEYQYYASTGSRASWEGKTGLYAFSVINLSSGFEKSISRKISLQVEPFVKLPVGRLGIGKVRLTTIGIFASAKIKL